MNADRLWVVLVDNLVGSLSSMACCDDGAASALEDAVTDLYDNGLADEAKALLEALASHRLPDHLLMGVCLRLKNAQQSGKDVPSLRGWYDRTRRILREQHGYTEEAIDRHIGEYAP